MSDRLDRLEADNAALHAHLVELRGDLSEQRARIASLEGEVAGLTGTLDATLAVLYRLVQLTGNTSPIERYKALLLNGDLPLPFINGKRQRDGWE